ncbi:hypothetical protein P3W53_23860 [Pseudomonas denitrificans (nom. rej.)]|nr:hypothetical protein [Pseudomonas denitrificans (nom. rej.)]
MQKYGFWIAPWLALLGLAFLYWPVTSLGYVWDDTALFLDSQLLRNPQNLWVSVSTQLLAGTSYFRPAVLLSFITEFKFFGVDPQVSHVVSYGLFLTNCLLVGLLAWRLSLGSAGSMRPFRVALAVLLYGCNPVLLESAAWISARFDLMVTLFVLLGCLALCCTRGLVRSSLTALCFLMALASKEMAITFPAIVVIWLWLERPDSVGFRQRLSVLLERKSLFLLSCVAVAAIVYLGTRYSLFAGLYSSDNSLRNTPFLTKIAFVGQTIWFYAHMSIWPFTDLSPMHPFDPLQMSAGQTVVGVAMVIAFLTLCATLALRGNRVGLLTLCALIALVPVINIVPLIISGNIGQDRFLTLPVAFLSLAVSQLALSTDVLSQAMQRTLPWMVGVLGFVWLGLGMLNIHLNTPLWKNEESLWTWAYEKAPYSETVRFNYVASLISQHPDKAEEVLEEIAASPQGLSRRLKGMKGQLLVRQGHYQDGLRFLDEGLVGELQPHKEIINKGLDLSKASITINGFPGSWYLRFVYGAKAEAYLYLGEYQKLEESLNIMRFYDANYPVVPLYQSFSAYAQGDLAGGDKYFEDSVKKFVQSRVKAAYAARANFVVRFCKAKSDQPVCQEKERFLTFSGA